MSNALGSVFVLPISVARRNLVTQHVPVRRYGEMNYRDANAHHVGY